MVKVSIGLGVIVAVDKTKFARNKLAKAGFIGLLMARSTLSALQVFYFPATVVAKTANAKANASFLVNTYTSK